MEDKRRDGDALHKTASHDSSSSSRSRRASSISNLGSGWFKKLSNKISNNEEEGRARANSESSVQYSTSEDETPVQRSFSIRQSRKRTENTAKKAPSVATTSSVHSVSPSSSTSLLPLAHPQTGGGGSSGSGGVTLEDLKRRKITTRAVGFALSTFSGNPSQRIPPAKPEVGNLEFMENGDMLVHRRTPSFYGVNSTPKVVRGRAETAKEAQIRARQNAERLHTSAVHGSFSSFFMHKPLVNDEEEPVVDKVASRDVDGVHTAPRSSHWSENPTGTSPNMPPLVSESEEEWELRAQNDASPPPDQVYIRCCHLREIMPIRNILRQLQGQLAPIPRLRIANTKPTLVEIQAFSDFLSVVPVATLVVNNHIMTDEMIRFILVGLSRSRDLARLTFTNTNLGTLGWQYLCAYLGNRAKGLLALNLSCTNPTQIPQRVAAFTRENMDWALLTEALAKAGTLEELDLGGTMIPFEHLKDLVARGFQKNGQILGLANNKLSHSEVKFIAEWANLPETRLMGINLSGNDLSHVEDWTLVQRFLTNPRILQVSLRNARLTSVHASHFVRAINLKLARESGVRQLDLSYNPGLFPHIIERLSAVLPQFPNLSRLQLDHCGLDSDMIITLSEAFSHCHRLIYLSVLGNAQLTETAGTALCVAVHLSRSICTVEADIPEENVALRQQLARYCVQNLEANTGASAAGNNGRATAGSVMQDDANADIISFYDDLRAVTKRLQNEDYLPVANNAGIIERVDILRDQIKHRLHSILVRRKVGPLTVSDREAAIRLVFYSTTLDKLKKELTGAAPNADNNAEEQVKNVDEEHMRPVLSRPASQISIISLKKLEREEGESHKAYAEKFMSLDDNAMLDAVSKLQLRDLEKIMN